MHVPPRPRTRALRLAAAAFSAGLVLSVAPIPTFAFVPVAAAESTPLSEFEPQPLADLAAIDDASEATLREPRVRAVEEDAEDFGLIGATFEAVPEEPVMVRVRDGSGRWGRWTELEVDLDKGPDPGTSEAAAAASDAVGPLATEPLWVGEGTGYELSVAEGDAHGVSVSVVRERVRRVVAESVPLADAATLAAPFTINSRASWGARAPKSTPSIASSGLRMAVVHHTAGSNSYTAAQVPGVIRGMQAYHMDTQKWSDLGYNFVVDKFGGLWEGRAGGTSNAVVGAHAGGFNTGTVGVSVMGDYTGIAASSAALESVSKIIGYRLQAYGIPPQGRVNFTSGGGTKYAAGTVVDLPRVIGHKDVGLTSCPGRIYDNLGSIRGRAAQWYSFMDALATPNGAIGTARLTGNRLDVIGWARDPDVDEPARVHVVVNGQLREVPANGYRPDVGRLYPGYGDNRGWSVGFGDLPEGEHRVCVTVINQGAGNDKLLGCRDIVVK